MRTVTGRLNSPTFQRWLPVMVLPPILLLDGLLSDKGSDVDLLSVLCAYVATLPLAFRERLGFFGMAPFLVGGVVLLLWNFEPGTTVVAIPAWALFDMARTYGRRETLLGAVLVGPCVLVSVVPFASGGAEVVSVTLRNLLVCELALAAGYAVWHGRAAMAREADRRLGDERLRIAREVHDVVAHAMVAINVQAGVAAHLIEDDTEQARQALVHIKRTSGDALADLRATLGILRDAEQDAPVAPSAGLGDLEGVAESLRSAGVEVEVDVDTVAPVPTPVQSAGYRIVQEALTNVMRHASAQKVTVRARADEAALSIVVADDGTGGVASTTGAGAGVRGMRERAEALGGTLVAGPVEPRGWRVEATLPLTAVRARA